MDSWSSLIRRPCKLLQLTRLEHRLLVESALLLPLFHVALSLFGYAKLRALLEWTALCAGKHQLSAPQKVKRIQQVTLVVRIASERGIYKATCLRRSLLTWWLLRREGIASDICLGVRTHGSILEAHAWVEYEGTVLNDRADVRQQFLLLQDTLPSTEPGR
jgi:hypothetical protein